MAGLVMNTTVRRDMEFGGGYQLTGQVLVGSEPSAFRVRLFDQYSGLLARETWSNAYGYYEFSYIANKNYYVTCHNHTSSTIAAYSNQTPSVM